MHKMGVTQASFRRLHELHVCMGGTVCGPPICGRPPTVPVTRGASLREGGWRGKPSEGGLRAVAVPAVTAAVWLVGRDPRGGVRVESGTLHILSWPLLPPL